MPSVNHTLNRGKDLSRVKFPVRVNDDSRFGRPRVPNDESLCRLVSEITDATAALARALPTVLYLLFGEEILDDADGAK